MLHHFYLLENMTILNEPAVDMCYLNIANKNENYEWDIIGIYKTFESLIHNVQSSVNYCHCPICMHVGDDEYKKQHIKDIKVCVYIMEFMKTITDGMVDNQVSEFVNSPKGIPLVKRIDEYYRFLDRFEIGAIDGKWKNKEWYYQHLFGIPWMIKRIGVPPEHYHFRKYYYFEDRIAGDPKSLCGWAREGLEDTLSAYSSPSNTSVAGEMLST